ncbi:MAG TPA: S9 family peptidase [Thermoanaerobaculia bacterium]
MTLVPPIAKRQPVELTIHGDVLVDDYAWLRDRNDPETIAYLEAENAYAEAVMSGTKELQETLYAEMLGRIKQTDVHVPYRKGEWLYYSRTVEGEQYAIFARKRTLDDDEHVVLDINALAAGHEFMDVDAMEVSDDGNLLAYTTDDNGYRQFRLHVKDLRTGAVIENIAERVGSVEWARDNRTLFYSIENDAKRQYRVYRHVLGSDVHELLFEETDELYDVEVFRARSGAYVFIVSDSKTTSEVQLLDAAHPEQPPRVMVPRREEHKYYAEHRGDRFYFMTNDAGINFRVVSAPVDRYDESHWEEVVPYREPVRIESIDLFRDHLVVYLREGGLPAFEVHDLARGGSHRIVFPEPAYTATPGANCEFDTHLFRYTYQSLVTPRSVYDYDLDARTAVLLERTEVLGGFDPGDYRSERFFVAADDGAQIPVAIVHRKDVDPRGGGPLHLYAYGSYGASVPDAFSSNRLSLLDRGIVFAIAHVRGGGEMGKQWHDQGRMMAKKNTFTDFIAVAAHLRANGYASRISIHGGSAGGLLVGAVINMRPELFDAAVAQVPFVDVINTMLDPTLPLTTQEYIEWGNPNELEAYRYMKSYDPYSNVERKAYPPLLVRTSLNDSQVGYWEAAKWLAKLRAHKSDDNELLLRVNMGAGHGGASGRYDRLREEAFDYAWLLRQMVPA